MAAQSLFWLLSHPQRAVSSDKCSKNSRDKTCHPELQRARRHVPDFLQDKNGPNSYCTSKVTGPLAITPSGSWRRKYQIERRHVQENLNVHLHRRVSLQCLGSVEVLAPFLPNLSAIFPAVKPCASCAYVTECSVTPCCQAHINYSISKTTQALPGSWYHAHRLLKDTELPLDWSCKAMIVHIKLPSAVLPWRRRQQAPLKH